MTWPRVGRVLSLSLVAAGSTLIADGLRHTPSESQAGIPLAELFPWVWAVAAVIMWTAASLAAWPRLDLPWRTMRLSTAVGLVGYGLIGGLSIARAASWAVDVGVGSIVGIWTVMLGLVVAVFTLVARVIGGE